MPAGIATQRRKITLRLPADLHDATQEAVRLGLAPNQNAFIEDAIRLREREVRHARMRQLAEQAMADPDFVADMRGVMEDFRHVDSERWPTASTSISPEPHRALLRSVRPRRGRV
jgi:Arc/MetJ-type ribon-helix-helix transcriptional regulator